MSITTTVLLDVMDLSGVFCVDDSVLTQVFFKIPFYGDAHMFCVVFQHTPAVFEACCEDWTNVDC